MSIIKQGKKTPLPSRQARHCLFILARRTEIVRIFDMAKKILPLFKRLWTVLLADITSHRCIFTKKVIISNEIEIRDKTSEITVAPQIGSACLNPT